MAFLEPGTIADVTDRTSAAFRSRYGRDPQVVGRAPGRVNLIGEHTDYNRGRVLPLALPHAAYVAIASSGDDTVRLSTGHGQHSWIGPLDDLAPGRVSGWAAYVGGVLWALDRAGYDVPGVEIHLESTVPVGAGLSSSAAVGCGVGSAVLGLIGVDLSPAVRDDLVAAAIRAETEVAGAPTGGMDQSISVLGTPGHALLIDFDSGSDEQIPIDLPGHLVLVTDTAVSHELTDGGYASRREDCEAAAAALGLASLRDADLADLASLEDRLRRRATHVVSEIGRVEEVVVALRAGDTAGLGTTFAASHRSMRDDFEISTPELDLAVAAALSGGAVAARMTGGGFGGSIVSIVPERSADDVVRSIDAAFATAGHGEPAHLWAVASAGACLTRS